MNFSKLIYLLSFWSFSDAEPAIFFELDNKKIVEIGEYANKVICYFCMSVCPVSSDSFETKLLNDNISITGNGIFLRKIYSEPIAAKEVETELCENPYSPALVYDDSVDSYEVGYELYYEKGKIKLTPNWYKYYYKVVDGKRITKWKEPPTGDVVYEYGHDVVFKIVTKPDITYTFYWISVLSFEMRNKKKHRIVTYTADTINDFFNRHNTTHNCEFYYSGDGRKIWDKERRKEDKQVRTKEAEAENREILEKNNGEEDEVHDGTVDKSSPKTEEPEKEKREILGKNIGEEDGEVKIHQTLDETPIKSKEPEEVINRLVKVQIIPMRMFHTVAARLATCMYFNFAFVWETIAKNQLKEIDLFLYAIYREWPWVTYLSFGVNGSLQGVDPRVWNEITSEDRLFRQFLPPKVVFRFIRIYLGNGRHYGAAVVVHNYHEPVKDTDRICSAEEELNSWDYLKNTDSATGFSYVCPLIAEVVDKLEGNLILELERMQPLKIDAFPLLNLATKRVREENVLERIKKRLRDIENMILD